MNDIERADLHRKLSDQILTVQEDYKHLPPEDVLPELVAALISLAAFISNKNMGRDALHFVLLCILEARTEWPPTPPD